MADLNCTACEDLRQEVPELVVNGFDDSMCASLKNDTGLKASSGNDDCTDLNTLNDCLIGNLEDEVERYDNCDWKTFTKMFANNAWTTLKAIICAICGLWTNVHNLWTTVRSFCITKVGNTISLTSNLGTHCSVTDSDTTYDLSISGHTVSLTGSDGSVDSVTVPDNDTTYTMSISGHTITLTPSSGSPQNVTVPDNDTWKPNTKNDDGYVTKGSGQGSKVWSTDADGNPAWRSKDVIDGQAFVRYYRDLGTSGDSVPFWENVQGGTNKTLDIYMNSGGASAGDLPADRDYVVMISNCTNYHSFEDLAGYVTYYSSGDTRTMKAIRESQGQHPNIKLPNGRYITSYSWTTSGSVILKKGEHIKVNFYAGSADKGSAPGSDSPKVRLHQFVLTWIPVSVQAISPN